MKKCKFCNNELRFTGADYYMNGDIHFIFKCYECLNSDIDVEYRFFEDHLLTTTHLLATTLISKTFNYQVLFRINYDLNEVNLFTNIGDLKLSEYYFNVNPVNFYNEITPIFNRLNKLVAFS